MKMYPKWLIVLSEQFSVYSIVFTMLYFYRADAAAGIAENGRNDTRDFVMTERCVFETTAIHM